MMKYVSLPGPIPGPAGGTVHDLANALEGVEGTHCFRSDVRTAFIL